MGWQILCFLHEYISWACDTLAILPQTCHTCGTVYVSRVHTLWKALHVCVADWSINYTLEYKIQTGLLQGYESVGPVHKFYTVPGFERNVGCSRTCDPQSTTDTIDLPHTLTSCISYIIWLSIGTVAITDVPLFCMSMYTNVL